MMVKCDICGLRLEDDAEEHLLSSHHRQAHLPLAGHHSILVRHTQGQPMAPCSADHEDVESGIAVVATLVKPHVSGPAEAGVRRGTAE